MSRVDENWKSPESTCKNPGERGWLSALRQEWEELEGWVDLKGAFQRKGEGKKSTGYALVLNGWWGQTVPRYSVVFTC